MKGRSNENPMAAVVEDRGRRRGKSIFSNYYSCIVGTFAYERGLSLMSIGIH